MHFTAEVANTELFYRTIQSVNWLGIYGAVACWCEKSCLKHDEKLPKTINDNIYIYIHYLEKSPTPKSNFFGKGTKE